jgi:predicted GTPase
MDFGNNDMPLRCIIMGAAGRDFHDFLCFFRDRPEFHVCCFTATQIPFIESRSFPKELAGPGYTQDIPIHLEAELPALIRAHDVDLVFLAYSDLPHEEVMHRASIVQAAGASFVLLGPKHTELESIRPVIAVTASRTGAGKSPLSQAIARHLRSAGRRVGILRHPMPYGDLQRQVVQRFATSADLDAHQCTVEEREEYEPYVDQDMTIYAGVDYRAILEQASVDSDVILWDGGNNDRSFIHADLHINVVDALRAGHELAYYPGESNLRAAHVLVINKVGQANEHDLATVRANIKRVRPDATVIEADLELSVAAAEQTAIHGKRALVIEDGPTITHGGMPSGAGLLAAIRYRAAEIIDPRPYAVGTIATAYAAYPHIGPVLPALGYSEVQRRELRETVAAANPDVIIDGSPAGLEHILQHTGPLVRVRYSFAQRKGPDLWQLIDEFLGHA